MTRDDWDDWDAKGSPGMTRHEQRLLGGLGMTGINES